MLDCESEISALFDELVPSRGKADTVAGEIVRAMCRIEYRFWNDGDHIGVNYGKETCNPAARYLLQTCGGDVGLYVLDAWGIHDDDLYSEALSKLERSVLRHLKRHPELFHTINHDDMWDCRNTIEDAEEEGDEF